MEPVWIGAILFFVYVVLHSMVPMFSTKSPPAPRRAPQAAPQAPQAPAEPPVDLEAEEAAEHILRVERESPDPRASRNVQRRYNLPPGFVMIDPDTIDDVPF